MKSKLLSQIRIEQNRAEERRTEQNRTEQFITLDEAQRRDESASLTKTPM